MKFSANISGRLIGFSLFLVYLIQIFIPWEGKWFIEMQSNATYRLWSGGLLFSLLVGQWLLTYARFVLQKTSESIKPYIRFHKLIGIYSPIIYFFHSANPGYGLLLFLTIFFFTNHLISIAYGKSTFWIRVFPLWIITHIFLAITLMIASIYHIYIVFAYK